MENVLNEKYREFFEVMVNDPQLRKEVVKLLLGDAVPEIEPEKSGIMLIDNRFDTELYVPCKDRYGVEYEIRIIPVRQEDFRTERSMHGKLRQEDLAYFYAHPEETVPESVIIWLCNFDVANGDELISHVKPKAEFATDNKLGDITEIFICVAPEAKDYEGVENNLVRYLTSGVYTDELTRNIDNQLVDLQNEKSKKGMISAK